MFSFYCYFNIVMLSGERKLALQFSISAALLAILIISKILSYLKNKLFPSKDPPVTKPSPVKARYNKNKRT